MKKITKIAVLAAFSLVSVFNFGCKSNDDDVNTQALAIENFLNANLQKVTLPTSHFSKEGDWIKFNSSSDADKGKSFSIFADKKNVSGFEVELKKTSGRNATGYGVQFCENANSYYTLLLTVNGRILVGEYNNGTRKILQNWTNNSSITTGYNKSNKVKVLKVNGNYKIYINGILVYTIENPELSDGYAGISAEVGSSAEETPSTTPVTAYFKFNELF